MTDKPVNLSDEYDTMLMANTGAHITNTTLEKTRNPYIL